MIPTDATRRTTDAVVTGDRKEIAGSLLKLGATSYGGPAMLGIMQGELQEKRQWVSKERSLEGLAVANMLPGATAAQLGIFFGYARGGLWGGVLAGLCFVGSTRPQPRSPTQSRSASWWRPSSRC